MCPTLTTRRFGTRTYENIKAIEWKSPKPLAVGSPVAFVAQFLGRRLAYIYE